jgi:hypothetical protein
MDDRYMMMMMMMMITYIKPAGVAACLFCIPRKSLRWLLRDMPPFHLACQGA